MSSIISARRVYEGKRYVQMSAPISPGNSGGPVFDRHGRVIAVSSIAGLRGLKGAPCYSASKHGMIGLIRALSADYATQPFTFNALCPAYVDTDIVPQNIERIMERTGMDRDAATQVMVGVNPHGRLVTPAEVAEAALWLCGPNSGSINGQAIQISGGEM